MMREVFVRDHDLDRLGLYRVALSEESETARAKALFGLQHRFDEWKLNNRLTRMSDHAKQIPKDPVVLELYKTISERESGMFDFEQTCRRYEVRLERKLNIAEAIGELVWRTIKEKEFRGVHSSKGILSEVDRVARDENVSGAKDKDVRRKIWNTYRGVVHIGIAENICEEFGFDSKALLELAEEIRYDLSHSNPKNSNKPYVFEEEQIKFTFKSMF